jgi:hypothetical protein
MNADCDGIDNKRKRSDDIVSPTSEGNNVGPSFQFEQQKNVMDEDGQDQDPTDDAAKYRKDLGCSIYPSFYTVASLLISCRNALCAKMDKDTKVLPDHLDTIVAPIVAMIMLVLGPQKNASQIFSFKRSLRPESIFYLKVGIFIEITKGQRSDPNGIILDVYAVSAKNCISSNRRRHTSQSYCGYFCNILLHYFLNVIPRIQKEVKAAWEVAEQDKPEPAPFDIRLDEYAFYDPKLKPYQQLDKHTNKMSNRKDASKVFLTAFTDAVDTLLGAGTSAAHGMHSLSLKSVNATNVLTCSKSTTPGSLMDVAGMAIDAGIMDKDDIPLNIRNKALIDAMMASARAACGSGPSHHPSVAQEEQIGLAGVIFGALKMVEKIMNDNPENHLQDMETSRMKR